MNFEIWINKVKQYDVVVVGSGPAGVAAAISAGRSGAKVLLIESCGRVGGISTSGMMSHFTGRCGSALYAEILVRVVRGKRSGLSAGGACRPGRRLGDGDLDSSHQRAAAP